MSFLSFLPYNAVRCPQRPYEYYQRFIDVNAPRLPERRLLKINGMYRKISCNVYKTNKKKKTKNYWIA